MTWSLPYPLGGEDSRQRSRYEDWVLTQVPPWLRRTVGGAIMQGIAATADSLVDRLAHGVRLRFPNTDTDALAIAGRERRIVRGPSEGPDEYALRVQGWLDAHRTRGSVYALLEQWNAYNATRRAIDVLYQSGTLYKLYEVVSPIDRAIISWETPPEGGWAQAWCFLFEDADPTPVSAATDAELGAIPRLWSAAHMSPLNVVLVWPGARLWGYPAAGLTWTEQEALYTWDNLVPHRVS